MYTNLLIAGICYWVVDILAMSKYVFQVVSTWKVGKAVGIARKYFVIALVREVFALWYGVALGNGILISLAIISFALNLLVLVVIIKYKRIPKKDWEWDDFIYNYIRRFICLKE